MLNSRIKTLYAALVTALGFVALSVALDAPASASNIQQPPSISGTQNDAVIIGPNGQLTDSGLLFTSSCGAFSCASGSLSSAQILALNSSPVTIVPAQGAGTIIQVDSVVMEMVSGTPYVLGFGTVSVDYSAAGTVATAGCTNTWVQAAANAVCFIVPISLTNTAATNVVNAGIRIIATGNPTTGTGTIQYRVRYHVVTGF